MLAIDVEEKGHWSRTCCTPNDLVEIYQASIKARGKEPKTNFVDHQKQKMKLASQLNMTDVKMDFANYDNSFEMNNVNCYRLL